MPIYPRGDSFMVSIGSGKARIRATCDTMPEAIAKERELLQARREASNKAISAALLGDTTKTLQNIYDRVYQDTWRGSKGERTVLINAKQILASIGADTPIVEITSEVIDDALDEYMDNGNTNSTVNKKLSALNVMLKEAHNRGWIKTVPYTKRKREVGQRIFWYTDEEETAMINGCQKLGMPDLANFIRFAIATGFRRGEMLGLKVSDCAGGVIRLHEGQTKNDDSRSIPSNEDSERVIEHARALKTVRVFDSFNSHSLRVAWSHLREYLGKSDDPKFIAHVLRHTTATRLALKGATAPQIQKYMGHKAIQTTMRYIHLTSEHLVDVAALLDRPTVKTPTLKLVNGGL